MPKKILDEFSHLPVSHQRKTQLRYERDGKCQICGGPRATKHFCLKHAVANRERRRKKTNAKRRSHSLTYRLSTGGDLAEVVRYYRQKRALKDYK